MEIIDSHAHLDPRMLDSDALIRRMDRHGVSKVALIPCMNDPLPHTPERLLSALRVVMKQRLTRPLAELIHRATMTASGDLVLSGKVYRIYPRPDNQVVADALARHPGRLLGWIFLNPRSQPTRELLDDLERFRAVPGMLGVKLHPHWHDYQTELLTPLFQRLSELRLPALVHLGFGRRGDFRGLAQTFPKVPLICAHAGFPFYGDLWTVGKSLPNLYVDLSSPYIDEALCRGAVAALGPSRCLYGTDAPYGFPAQPPDEPGYDYGRIKGWIERLPVSSGEREAIFGDNLRALLAPAGMNV